MKVKQRNLKIERVKVGDIVDNPRNWRTHDEAQAETFRAARNELGWYGYPDVYALGGGKYMLIDGELRTHDLRDEFGDEMMIEVNVTDFNEHEAQQALLTKDPLAEMATANAGKLKGLLEAVEFDDPALESLLDAIATQHRVKWEVPLEEDQEDDGEQGWEVEEDEADWHEAEIRMVTLFLTRETAAEWDVWCETLAEHLQQTNPSDTVLAVLEAAAEQAAEQAQ